MQKKGGWRASRTFHPCMALGDAHFCVRVWRERFHLRRTSASAAPFSTDYRNQRTMSPSSAMMRFTTNFESTGDLHLAEDRLKLGIDRRLT